MEDDHIFKVPTLKKRRSSLYCMETLDGLDDLWKCSSTTAQVPGSPLGLHSIYSSYKTTRANQARTVEDCNQSEVQELGHITTEGDYIFQSGQYSSQNKYMHAVGLLDELCKNEANGCQLSLHDEISVNNDISGQPLASNTFGMQGAMYGSCSTDEDSKASTESLIVPDESMASTDTDSCSSDIDWDSLTPPAPRSPGDHTVPDMYDLDGINTPSDCLVYSYDYLASVQQGGTRPSTLPMAAAQRNVQSLPIVSPQDHIVPDFYS